MTFPECSMWLSFPGDFCLLLFSFQERCTAFRERGCDSTPGCLALVYLFRSVFFPLRRWARPWHRWIGRRFTSGSTSCPARRPVRTPCSSSARSASPSPTWPPCSGTRVALSPHYFRFWPIIHSLSVGNVVQCVGRRGNYCLVHCEGF